MRRRRVILIPFFALILHLPGLAQLSVQVNIAPTISPHLYEWELAQQNDILVTVTNLSSDAVPAAFAAQLTYQSGEVGHSLPDEAPVMNITPGTSVFPLAELIPTTAIEYDSDFDQTLVQTGQLPDGNYELCVTAYQPELLQPISEPSCAPFTILAYQDPVNVYPPDGESINIDEVANLVFQWSPVAPTPDFGETYILTVYEVFPGQSPFEAVEVNPTILDEYVEGATQFVWPIEYSPLDTAGQGYVWTVMPISPDGSPYSLPDGRSPPTEYHVTSSTPPDETDCECVSCEFEGLLMSVNGVETSTSQVPSNTPVSFAPHYSIVCSQPDCQTSFEGTIHAQYSSQLHPNQEWDELQIGEEITLPGKGLLYLSWTGTAYCDESLCECNGSATQNIQWQVKGDDVVNPTDTVDTDDHTTEATPDSLKPDCECGSCALKSLQFLQNGSPVTGSNIPTGAPLTIAAEWDIACNPADCPPTVDGYFQIGYTPEGGNWTAQKIPDANTPFTIPEGIGMIVIEFVGTVSCEGEPCPCDFTHGLEYFTGPPGTDTPPFPEDSIPPDTIPERVPPPEKQPKECDPLVKQLDPAQKIDLGMILDDPGTFPYPRAVPLRAEGIDWDYAIFTCDGCEGGPSETRYPVKDKMNLSAYQWKIIKGPGALDDPFRADSLQKIEEERDSLVAKLQELEARKVELENRLNTGIAADSTKYGSRISELEETKTGLEEDIQAQTDSIAVIKGLLDAATERFDLARDSLDLLNDSIAETRLARADVQKLLTNPPSEAELNALAVVETKKESLDNANENLTMYEVQMELEAQLIADNLNDLSDAQKDANQAYLNQRDLILNLTETISDLENQLYSAPLLQKYRRTRTIWNQRARVFEASFVSAGAFAASFQTRKENINSSARTLATTPPAGRADMYTDLHQEILQFIPLPSQICMSVPSEQSQDCGEMQGRLIEATLNLDTALANLNSSQQFINGNQLAQLQQMRDSLALVKDGLENYRAATRTAAQAYQSALAESVNQLKALEAERNAYIEAVEDARAELAEAQKVYADAKALREKYFEEHEPQWQDSLAGIQYRLTTQTGRADLFFDRLSFMQDSVNTLFALHDKLNTDKAELDAQLETLNMTLDRLREKLDALRDEPEKLEKEIDDLEQEIAAIKKKLEKVEKRKNKLSNPRRSAVGPQVYYIPPPLEKVLELNGKKPKFDELVAKLDSAKAQLKVKRAAKAALQAKLATAIDDVGWELLSYKHNTDEAENLKEELEELNLQLASDQQAVIKKPPIDTISPDDLKNEFFDDLLEAKEELQKIKEENQELKDAYEDRLIEKNFYEDMLEDVKEDLEEAFDDFGTKDKKFRDSNKELNEIRRKVTAQQKEIAEIKKKIGRQQNKENIDKAARDEDQITGNDEDSPEIQSLRDELKAAEDHLESLEFDLTSIELRHAENNDALIKSRNHYFNTDSVRRELKESYLAASDSVLAAKEAVVQNNSSQSRWEQYRAEAERNFNKVLQIEKEQLERRNKIIDNDSSVVGTKAEIDRTEEQLSDLEDQLNKGERKVNDKLSKTEEWIQETNRELREAIAKRDKAEEDLRSWLVQEFEKVFMEVKIQLTGDDEVCDQWRSNDGQAKLIRTLTYANTRVPSLNNKHAQGGMPRTDKDDICDVVIDFNQGITPDESLPPTPRGPEPRTIALIYENGRPLWPEWPVIDQDETRYLQHDVLFLRTAFSPDFDYIKYLCESHGDCEGGPPIWEPILDPGRYNWEVEGRLINPNQNWRYATWETDIVPIPKKWKQQKLKSIFNGDLIVSDPEVKSRSQYQVHPGVLIEVPDSLFGKPDTAITFHGRTVAGDHRGLVGEKMVFTARLTDGESEGWGFDGDTIKEVATDGDGYGEVDFDFGDGYARFEITVTWYRGNEIMDREELPAIAPLRIKIHRMGPGPPEPAWQMAYSIVGSGKIGNMKSLTEGLPNCTYDGDSEPAEDCAREMRCVAGLTNYYYDFVEGETIEFSVNDKDIRLEEPEDTTATFGLATTLLKDMPEDVEAEVTASILEEYLPLGRPGVDKAGASTELIEEFYIGEEGSPFLVILDSPVPQGTTVSGTGMFGASDEGILGVMIQLANVKLTLTDVSLEKKDGTYFATAGTVAWEGEVSTTIRGFDIQVTKVGVEALNACVIAGTVAREQTLPDPIAFTGMLSPSGDFLAGLKNLPEITIKDFVLKQGAEVELDMMSNAGQDALPAFKGIFIKTAELQLPDAFKRASTNEPTVLSVENFSVGSEGVSGKVELSGSFFEIGFRGYVLEGKSISATFVKNELDGFSAGGSLALGTPFSGKIATKLGYSGDEYFANLSTEHPVEIPTLKAIFNILPNTGITKKGKEYSLRINALVATEDLGDLTVKDFMVSPKGEISAEEISLDGSIKFGRGFEIQKPDLSFRLKKKDYFVELAGTLVFPLIDDSFLSGTVALYTGPKLEVSLDSARISVEFKKAVKLEGGFRFNGNEFRGDFAVSIKNLPGDIEGLFLIGSQDTESGNGTFTYWYAELTVPVAIPLGQTGLSILKLGGGIGYSYFPPTSESEGYPVEGGAFAFKAMLGFGNTPAGKVFAGDVEMVLATTAFSLTGRVWVLTLRETFYGAGQLTLHFQSPPKLDGHVRMLVALPDKEGKLINFDGKIKFLFSEPEWYIRSTKIEGLFLSLIEAEGHVDVDDTKIHLDASLGFSVNKSFDFTEQEKILIDLDVAASGTFDYIYAVPSLTAQANFSGNWSVLFKNRIYDLTITSGNIELEAALKATSSVVSVGASADLTWNFFIASGSYHAELGYSKAL